MVSALIKQSYVRRFYRSAVSGNTTLEAVLETLNETLVDSSKSGLVFTSTTANGFRGELAVLSGLSPVDAMEMVAELLNLHSEAVTELEADGIESPTQLQLRDRMLAMLVPGMTSESDYSGVQL